LLDYKEGDGGEDAAYMNAFTQVLKELEPWTPQSVSQVQEQTPADHHHV